MTSAPVLITGVGQRVGFHLAHALLKQNIPVVGTYRSPRDSLDELTRQGCHLFQCDFNKQAQVDTTLSAIKAEYTHLRAVIHNASDWLADDDRQALAVFDRMMQVHVRIPYYISLSLAPLLQAFTGKSADIIHISDHVTSNGSAKHAAYVASKAALESLTLSLAKKYAPHIKVNTIAPALIQFNSGDDPSYKQKALNKALIPREGGYREIERAVMLLLESDYITGVRLPVNGGRHIA